MSVADKLAMALRKARVHVVDWVDEYRCAGIVNDPQLTSDLEEIDAALAAHEDHERKEES